MLVIHFFSGVTKFQMRTITWYRNLTGRYRLLRQRGDGCYHINKGLQQRGEGCYRTNKGLSSIMLHGALEIPPRSWLGHAAFAPASLWKELQEESRNQLWQEYQSWLFAKPKLISFLGEAPGKKAMLAIRGPPQPQATVHWNRLSWFFFLSHHIGESKEQSFPVFWE